MTEIAGKFAEQQRINQEHEVGVLLQQLKVITAKGYRNEFNLISIKDLNDLFECWGKTYKDTLDDANQLFLEAQDEIVTEGLSKIWVIHHEHKMITDQELSFITKEFTAYLYQTSYLCLFIGVENGKGNIELSDVPLYLFLISENIMSGSAAWINRLRKIELFNFIQMKEMVEAANDVIQKNVVNIYEKGYACSSGVHYINKSGKNSSFLKMLFKLKRKSKYQP